MTDLAGNLIDQYITSFVENCFKVFCAFLKRHLNFVIFAQHSKRLRTRVMGPHKDPQPSPVAAADPHEAVMHLLNQVLCVAK